MKYEIKVNGKLLRITETIVTGDKILNVAGFLPTEDFDLYKKIKGKEFEPIQLTEEVNLEEPGIEFFRVIPRKELEFEVDDEIYRTSELELTSLNILSIINLNPDQFYLKQIIEHMEVNYKNDLDKLIDMLQLPRFITCKKDPTPVS